MATAYSSVTRLSFSNRLDVLMVSHVIDTRAKKMTLLGSLRKLSVASRLYKAEPLPQGYPPLKS